MNCDGAGYRSRRLQMCNRWANRFLRFWWSAPEVCGWDDSWKQSHKLLSNIGVLPLEDRDWGHTTQSRFITQICSNAYLNRKRYKWTKLPAKLTRMRCSIGRGTNVGLMWCSPLGVRLMAHTVGSLCKGSICTSKYEQCLSTPKDLLRSSKVQRLKI